MNAPTAKRPSALAMRAVERAIAGGEHQVLIRADGHVTILPLTAAPAQADESALDAEVDRLINGNGNAAH